MEKKKIYQIWMVIEERTTDDEGNETYVDFDDETRSAGMYGTLEEAVAAMDEIHNERSNTYLDQ